MEARWDTSGTGDPKVPARARQRHTFAAHVFSASVTGILLKQLRFIGESIGAFEIAALGCALYFIASNSRRALASDVYFVHFMLLQLGAFCCGAVVSLCFFPEHFSPREVAATIYTSIIVLGWVFYTEGEFIDRVRLLRNYLAIYCAAVVLFATIAYPIAPWLWYFDVYLGRLMGLSDNPNQLAGLCVFGMAMSAIIVDGQRGIRGADVGAGAAILIAGLMTHSVTFALSIAVSALLALTVHVWSRDGAAHRFARQLFSFGIQLALLGGLLILVLFGGQIIDALVYLYQGGSAKGATRLGYWIAAMGEVASSPIVGFGPGGHVQVENSPVLQEAHNIFVELLLSGGIVSLAAFVMLLTVVLVASVRYRAPSVVFAVCALVILGSFHTVLRHGYYWIALHASMTALFLLSRRNLEASPSEESD